MSDYCISHIQKYWKELTELSDKSFAKKDFSTALFLYQEAFYRAEVLVKEVDRCICLNIPSNCFIFFRSAKGFKPPLANV